MNTRHLAKCQAHVISCSSPPPSEMSPKVKSPAWVTQIGAEPGPHACLVAPGLALQTTLWRQEMGKGSPGPPLLPAGPVTSMSVAAMTQAQGSAKQQAPPGKNLQTLQSVKSKPSTGPGTVRRRMSLPADRKVQCVGVHICREVYRQQAGKTASVVISTKGKGSVQRDFLVLC